MAMSDARDASMNAAGRAFRARSRPDFAGKLRSPSGAATSSSTTGIPADAARAAMPLPMVPAPMTPSLAMRMTDRVWEKRTSDAEGKVGRVAKRVQDSPLFARLAGRGADVVIV